MSETTIRKAGPRPAVASQNQAAAALNIDVKIRALQILIGEIESMSPKLASGAMVPVDPGQLPTTVRQFNAWTSSELQPDVAERVATFSRNANQTLNRNVVQLGRVKLAVGAAAALRNRPEPGQKREARVAALIRQARLAESLQKVSEQELIELKRLNEQLSRRVAAKEKALLVLERETKAAIAAGERRFQELSDRHAALLKAQSAGPTLHHAER